MPFNNPFRVLNSERVYSLLKRFKKCIILIFLIFISVPSFSQKKEDYIKKEIVGKWKYIDSKYERTWTFEEKVKAVFEVKGEFNPGYSKINYTYKFRSKNKIILNPGNKPESSVSEIRISGDTLYLNTFKYIRQK